MRKDIGGWLELRQAIELIGPLIHPAEWTGQERYSPEEGEAATEFRAIFDLTPEQLAREHAAARTKIEAEAKQERAAREASDLRSSGIREGLERLRAQLAGEKEPRRRLALERLIKSLSAPMKAQGATTQPSRREIARQRAEFAIDMLTEQQVDAYRPARVARMRWLDTHASLREEVCAGRIRIRLEQPGLPPVYPTIEEITKIFPLPGERRAVMDGFPARFFFARADLETVFAPQTVAKPAHEPEKEPKPPRRSQAPEQDRIAALMIDDLNERRETPDTLDKIKHESLRSQYGKTPGTDKLASRYTCLKAKAKALLEFAGRQTATTDK